MKKQTKETDTADEISRKAKEIDASKHELQSFKSAFVVPRKLSNNRKRINTLKVKAAKFLTLKFESIYTHPNIAIQAAGKFVSRCAKIQQAFDVKCNLHIICKIQIRFIGARNFGLFEELIDADK